MSSITGTNTPITVTSSDVTNVTYTINGSGDENEIRKLIEILQDIDRKYSSREIQFNELDFLTDDDGRLAAVKIDNLTTTHNYTINTTNIRSSSIVPADNPGIVYDVNHSDTANRAHISSTLSSRDLFSLGE
jgi:hypothetical protein